MNTTNVANVSLLTIAIAAITKGIEIVTTNLIPGIVILAVGVIVLAIYETKA